MQSMDTIKLLQQKEEQLLLNTETMEQLQKYCNQVKDQLEETNRAISDVFKKY